MADHAEWLYPLRNVTCPLDARFTDARISDLSLADVITRAAVKHCGCGAEAEKTCKDCGMPLCNECGSTCEDCEEPLCDTCVDYCYRCGMPICHDCAKTGDVLGAQEAFCDSCYDDLEPLEDDDNESNG